MAQIIGGVYRRYQSLFDGVSYALYLLWQRKSPVVGLLVNPAVDMIYSYIDPKVRL